MCFTISSCTGNITNKRSQVNRVDAALDTSEYIEPEHTLRVFSWERDYDGNRWTTELVKGEEIEVGPLVKYNNDFKMYVTSVIDNDVLGTYLCSEFDGPIKIQVQDNLYPGMIWKCKTQNYKNIEHAVLGSNFVDGSNRIECDVELGYLTDILLYQSPNDVLGNGNFRDNIYYKEYITEQKLTDVYADAPEYMSELWRGIIKIYIDVIGYDTKDMSEIAKATVLLRYYSLWRTDNFDTFSSDDIDSIYTALNEKQIQDGRYTAELVDYWQVETEE
jgi:hypothetical protein